MGNTNRGAGHESGHSRAGRGLSGCLEVMGCCRTKSEELQIRVNVDLGSGLFAAMLLRSVAAANVRELPLLHA